MSPLFTELRQALLNQENTYLSGLFTSAVSLYASALYAESEHSMIFILR